MTEHREPEHFPGCHLEDAEDPRETPKGYQPQETEDCWHCGTPTTRGCNCESCLDFSDGILNVVHHCPVCRRWWAWMTLNIAKITFGPDDSGGT